MNAGDEVLVISRSYDLSVRRSWKARLTRSERPLLELVGEFDRDVEHADLGLVARGTVSYEYYWLDRWYNVFRFHEPDGTFRNYYCNINMPPRFEDGVLDYVDLDIDVLVWPDGRQDVLDRADFDASAKKFDFTDDLKGRVDRALNEMLDLIGRREFPFDGY
jgi:protein associated with RNAse G/E